MKSPDFLSTMDYGVLKAHALEIPHSECLLNTICEASNDPAFGVLFSMVYFLLELQNRTLWMLPAADDTTMTCYALQMLRNVSEWGVPYMEAKKTELTHTKKGKQLMLSTGKLCYTNVCKTAADWLPLSPHMQHCEKLLSKNSDVQKLAFMLRMRRDVVRSIDTKFNCKLSEDAGSVEHNDINDVMFVAKFVEHHPLRTATAYKRHKHV